MHLYKCSYKAILCLISIFTKMKNLLFILVSLLLLSFLSSCTAEELPETKTNFQMETVDPNSSGGETDPPTLIPPRK